MQKYVNLLESCYSLYKKRKMFSYFSTAVSSKMHYNFVLHRESCRSFATYDLWLRAES